MDRDAFDRYWKENYVPLTYADVKEEFEQFAISVDKQIFTSEYAKRGDFSREDFIENLSRTAEFTFQNALTDAFYDKNPEIYETAFALFEEAQMSEEKNACAAMTFDEEYQRLYREFLQQMFDVLYTEGN